MNSAYRSRLRLTSSSRRTWRVVVFGCLDGAFSSDNCFAPFFFRCAVRLALQAVCSDLCTRTKHGTAHFGAGGSDPRNVWAAASRTRRGRSRPFLCFVRVQMSPVAFMYPLFFQESVIELVLIWELKPYLKCRALASRHPISCCCRRIRPPGLAR